MDNYFIEIYSKSSGDDRLHIKAIWEYIDDKEVIVKVAEKNQYEDEWNRKDFTPSERSAYVKDGICYKIKESKFCPGKDPKHKPLKNILKADVTEEEVQSWEEMKDTEVEAISVPKKQEKECKMKVLYEESDKAPRMMETDSMPIRKMKLGEYIFWVAESGHIFDVESNGEIGEFLGMRTEDQEFISCEDV